MEIRYTRSLNRNYLNIFITDDTSVSSFPVQMLLTGKVGGLLPCTLENIDGKACFSFDISSRQPLSVLFEHGSIRLPALRQILGTVFTSLRGLQDYFLDASLVLMDPDYVYGSWDLTDFRLLFLPGELSRPKGSIVSVLEYLLSRIDPDDPDALILCYRLYRAALDGNTQPEELLKLLLEQENAEEFSESTAFSGSSALPPVFDPFDYNPAPDEEAENARLTESEAASSGAKKTGRLSGLASGLSSRLPLPLLLVSVFIIAASGLRVFEEGPLPEYLIPGGIAFFLAVISAIFLLRHSKKKRAEAAGQDLSDLFDDPEGLRSMFPEEDSEEERRAGSTLFRNSEMERPAGERLFRSTQNDPAADIDHLLNEQETDPEEEESRTILLAAPSSAPARLNPVGQNPYPPLLLPKRNAAIGKQPGLSDLIVPHATVSRIHARIYYKNREYFIEDANSRNGTWLNGEPVIGKDRKKLRSGDRVRFAAAEYEFHNEG